MKTSRIIGLAMSGLARQKMRTFLMMLGIVIGVATLTVIISLTKGAQHKVMKGIKNFGANSVMASAGGGRMFGPPDGSTVTLTMADAEAMQASIKGIKHIAPFTMHVAQTVVAGSKNTEAAVFGVTPAFADAWQWFAEKGDFISDEDVSGLSKNCVLGQTVVRELFGDQDPIGETVRLNNTNFTVVGVLTKRGASPHGMDMDNRVLVPLSTAMRRLYNTTALGMIRLYVDDPDRLDEVTASVTAILRERHHIAPPQEDDFRVTNSMAMAGTIKGVSKTLTTFLLLLASISLVVGGLVLGVAAAIFATRLIRGLLFGVAPHDPATFIAVAATMAGIGTLACWIPALRAGVPPHRIRAAPPARLAADQAARRSDRLSLRGRVTAARADRRSRLPTVPSM